MRSTRPQLSLLGRALSLALPMGVALALLCLWWLDPIALQSLRLAQFDQFQRWQPRQARVASVTVVDIDERSLAAYGQWPWPRTRLAELVRRLQEAGARVVAFDVLLAEPDHSAPQALARLWQQPPLTALLQGLPDPDAVLAQTLADGAVVLGSSLGPPVVGATTPRPQTPAPYRLATLGPASSAHWLHRFAAGVGPLPVLAASARGLGAMNFIADADGVLRRVPLMLRQGDQIVPSLTAEALRLSLGERNYVLRATEAGVQELRIGHLTVPTNAHAELWLDFGQKLPAPGLSAAQVLAAPLKVGQLDGQIVLIGSSAAGLMDLRANPLGQTMAGVQAHAMALAQMLSGQHLLRPAWARGAEALALSLAALLAGLVALRWPIRWSALVAAAVLTVLLAGAWLAFVQARWLLDALNPALAVLLSFALASGVRHRLSEREQRWLRQAFSRYVSPNRVAHLLAHPEQLTLSGQRQHCSFVFTDLEGFTPMLEGGDPARIVTVVNDYLDAMLAIVFKHEGTLDRFMGDALVVMFSAPVVQLDYRQRALDCALEMHRFASAYARQQQARGLAWGSTRIGVHCGEVIVGNFGGRHLFDYRALGDPINTAARLESVNKQLGTRVCVSQAILAACPGVLARPVGRLVLKGKTEALQAFEPLAATESAECAPLAHYRAAFEQLQQGAVVVARECFETLAARYPLDPLLALHLTRLRQGARNDLMVLAEK